MMDLLFRLFACRRDRVGGSTADRLRQAAIFGAGLFFGGAALSPGVGSAEVPAIVFDQTGVSGGGDLVVSAINPHNHNQIYIGCDMMGMYRTANQGVSWSLIPSSTFSATLRSKVQFTRAGSGRIQYAIRRSSWASQDSFPCVSTDHGNTWTPINLPPNSSSGSVFGSLFADPDGLGTRTQRLILEDYQKIWFTRDGGASYSSVHEVTGDESLRVAGVFWDGARIFVATNKGLHVSTDRGSSWVLETGHAGLPDGAQFIEFCGARNPSTGVVSLFAIPLSAAETVVSWTDLRFVASSSFQGLYKMDYTGPVSSWVDVTPAAPDPVRHVAVPAHDSRYPWASSGLGNAVQILKSTDGGSTWANTFKSVVNSTPGASYSDNQNITTGYQGDGGLFTYYWGDVVSSLSVADNDPRFVVATGTMPYVTKDGGATWRQAYVARSTQNKPGTPVLPGRAYGQTGLNVTTAHWVHSLSARGHFIGSTDIGNQYSEDDGATWTFERNPAESWGSLKWGNVYCIVSRHGGTRIYAAVSDTNDMYEPEKLSDDIIDGGKGDVLASDDHGVTWQSASGPGKGLPGDKFPGPVVWLAVDPNPARASWLYASVAHSTLGGIYLTKDNASTWTRLSPPPRTEGHPFSIGVRNMAGELVASYSARLDASGNLTESSGVFCSTDFGATWSDRTAPDMRRYTKDVTWNPNDAGVFYAAVQGGGSADGLNTGTGGLYRSNDSGLTWQRVFVNESCQSASGTPGDRDLVFVTTGADGLYATDHDSAPAPAFTKLNSLPFARTKRTFVHSVSLFTWRVWVTTQGGGVYRGTLQRAPSAVFFWRHPHRFWGF